MPLIQVDNNRFRNAEHHLFAHWDDDAAIAAAAPHHAMDTPRTLHGHENPIKIAIDIHLELAHVERDQRRRVALAMDVRLVARKVGVVHDRRVGDHRVDHGRRRLVGRCRFRRLLDEGGPGRREAPILSDVDALGELETGLHRVGELVEVHLWLRRQRSFRRKKGGVDGRRRRRRRRRRRKSQAIM